MGPVPGSVRRKRFLRELTWLALSMVLLWLAGAGEEPDDHATEPPEH